MTKGASSLSATVLKALSIFSGVQAIEIISSVIRTKLIAIWIGPVGVGLLAIYNSVTEMLSSATQLNMRQSAVRDISSATGERVSFISGVVRWWASRLGLLGAVTIILLSPLLSYISFDDTDHWWAFALLSIMMFCISVSRGDQALLQGTGKLKLLAKASVLIAVTGTLIAIPLFYYFREHSIVMVLVLFAVISMVITRWCTNIHVRHNSTKENIREGKGFIKLGAYLTISSVVTTMASYAFISYLNVTSSETATGIYQAGYTLVIRYTEILFTALSMEFFPRIVKIAARRNMTSVVVSHELLMIMYVLTPCIVLFMSLAHIAISILYADTFMAALPFVLIGICAIVFRAISYCLAYVIIARGDGRVYIVTEVSSALIGLALNITFYHYMGYVGLGISYIIWYAIYTLLVWLVYHYRYGMRITGGAVRAISGTLIISAISLALRALGWWAVLPMLIPALSLSYNGYRHLFKKR